VTKRGRPTQDATPGTKASLGLTVTAGLKARLDAEAARTGRTQSQEAQWRLERSFDHQDLLDEVLALFFGQQTASILALLGDALGRLERVAKESDPATELNVFDAADAVEALMNGLKASKPLEFKIKTAGHAAADLAALRLRMATDNHWKTVATNLAKLNKKPKSK
jgi:hypothetical protein